jgi:hypothetical protein
VKRVFISLPSFWNDWIRSGLADSDLIVLETTLLRDTESGDLVRETGGIRKVRFARPGTGKSSGVRVFYLDLKSKEKLFFLAVIQKNEKENLSKSERNEFASLVKLLKEETNEPVQKDQSRPRRSDRV